MRWVLINRTHINTDHVLGFYWGDGVLHISYVSAPGLGKIPDPDKALYTRLCHLLGLRPAED